MSDPFFYADRVKETTTTTGAGGVYSLAGAATGFRTFASQFDGYRCYYFAQDAAGNWEQGIGAVAAGSPDTLTVESVEDSSDGGSAIDWPAGTKEIWCGLPARRFFDAGGHPRAVQNSTGYLYKETADDTPTVLDAVPETAAPFTDLSVVTALVTAQDYGSLAKGWELKALFGPSGMIGSLTKTVIGASTEAASWDVDMDIDGSNQLQITVTGDPSIALTWAASVFIGSTKNN